MQHPFGALTRNFRLIRWRKFRGQQPAGPAGDGETQIVWAKCLMSLNGHLLNPGGASPPCLSFTRFIVEQCLLKKTSIWPLLTVWKLPSHHIVLNTADTRHTVMPWRIPFPPELFRIGIVCLLLWQIPSPQRSLGHFLFKFSQMFLVFFVLFRFFCVVFVFYFYQNFQIRTPRCKSHVWANQ